jgi:hypothetical protein
VPPPIARPIPPQIPAMINKTNKPVSEIVMPSCDCKTRARRASTQKSHAAPDRVVA